MQNTILNNSEQFNQLNKARHDMGEFYELSLWPELVPVEPILVSRHEYWMLGDLLNILNIDDKEKYQNDITLCNAFYGATPKKLQPKNPQSMTDLKKQHIYKLDNRDFDAELSRYACWTLVKDIEKVQPTTFFQVYYIAPNASLKYLNRATDELNRIPLRATVAKYQKQMNGIMKSFKVKNSQYYADLNNMMVRWLFGNLSSGDIRNEYNIAPNKPLADYMNDKLLAVYACTLKNIINIWDNQAPSHEYTTLYGIIYNEMTNARSKFKFGRPENNFEFRLQGNRKEPISVAEVEKWKKWHESKFVQKYINEKVR